MALQTVELKRVFKYNALSLQDPGPQYTPIQVRDLYSATYPEINTAAIEGPEEKNGELIYTFRRAVGTKGTEIDEASKRAFRLQIMQEVENYRAQKNRQAAAELFDVTIKCLNIAMTALREFEKLTKPKIPLFPWEHLREKTDLVVQFRDALRKLQTQEFSIISEPDLTSRLRAMIPDDPFIRAEAEALLKDL